MAEHSLRSNTPLLKKAIEVAKMKCDDWNLDMFTRMDGRRLSQADEDCLREYLSM